MQCPFDLGGVASDGLAVALKHAVEMLDAFRTGDDVHDVAVHGERLQRASLARAANHDRYGMVATLARRECGLLEGVVLAVEVHAVLGMEQHTDQCAGLLEAVRPLAHGRELPAVGFVLADVPAGPDAEHHAAVGDDIDGGRHLGHQRGVPVGVAGDQDPELELLCDRRHRCQQGPALKRGQQFVLHHLVGSMPRGDEVVVGKYACPSAGLHDFEHGLDFFPCRLLVDELRSKHPSPYWLSGAQ